MPLNDDTDTVPSVFSVAVPRRVGVTEVNKVKLQLLADGTRKKICLLSQVRYMSSEFSNWWLFEFSFAPNKFQVIANYSNKKAFHNLTQLT